MIEVIHFQNRFGKQLVGVLEYQKDIDFATPAGKEYAQRYAAGLEKPFYPLPVLIKNTPFVHYHIMVLRWLLSS